MNDFISDFDAKPMVLLLGQYSVGKTSFIRYLLERDFPGMNIGPEPTTDRFSAIMFGQKEMLIPGNALAVQADKPFRGLSSFGNDFLNRFQGSFLPSNILEDVSFIDTPGVLSGEKQRVGRQYDFTSVIEWFANRCDMILLLFDAHKLDISDEFKRAIEALKGNDDKIRCILNKADSVTGQQLMRVYGALMWSLGKVMQTPEVMRVYISSFWDQSFQNTELGPLFEKEREDLLKDLFSLPKYNTIRKINELVKRARTAKVHAHLISYIGSQMPSLFGKDTKKQEILTNIKTVFFEVHKKYQLAVGDFPPIDKFKSVLQHQDFGKFPKLNVKLIESMDTVLSEDIPKLMQRFPVENQTKTQNPFEEEEGTDPFSEAETGPSAEEFDQWRQKFVQLGPQGGKISGKTAKEIMMASALPTDQLRQVWALSDQDKDGMLNEHEFLICMQIIRGLRMGTPLPDRPPQLQIPKPTAVVEMQPSDTLSQPFGTFQ